MKLHFGTTSFDKFYLERDYKTMKDGYWQLMLINPQNRFKAEEEDPIEEYKKEALLEYLKRNTELNRHHKFEFY